MMRSLHRFAPLVAAALFMAACAAAPEPTATPTAAPTPSPTATITPTPRPTATPAILPETRASEPSQQVYLRMVHAAPDTPTVDFYIELLGIATNLSFGRGTDPTGIVAGDYNLKIVPAGNNPDDSPLLTTRLSFKGGQSLILLLTGAPDHLILLTFDDSAVPLNSGESRVRAIHAVPGGVNFALRVGNMDVTAPISFGQISSDATLPNGETAIIFLNGTTPLHTYALNLRPLRSYTLILTGRSDGSPLSVIALETRVPGRSSIRVINASAPTGPMDIYLGDMLMAGNVTYGRASERQLIAADQYQVSVYAAGANRQTIQPLTGSQLNANPDDIITLIVIGPAENLRIVTRREDLSRTPAGQTRMTFVNTLDTVPSVRVETSGGPLPGLPDLGYGQVSPEITLDAGVYTLYWNAVVNNASTSVVETALNIQLEPGRSYLYLLSGKSDDQPPVILSENVGVNEQSVNINPDMIETPAPEAPTRIRLVNTVSTASLIDVLLDDEVLVSGLGYGRSSELLTVAGGNHVFTVKITGSDMLTGRFEHDFAAPGDYSLFAYGAETTRIDLLLVPDSDLVFDTQSSHLRLINLTQDVFLPLGMGYILSSGPVTQPSESGVIQGQPSTGQNSRESIPVGVTRLVNDVEQESFAPVARTPIGVFTILIIDTEQSAIAATVPNVDLKGGVHYDVIAFQEIGLPQVRVLMIPYSIS